jgi:RNA polymerase sigma-70 factor, ECF subfamily
MLRDTRTAGGGCVAPSAFGAQREATIELDDSALVAACQRGDEGAFERLVERHQRFVYQLCFRYTQNHADAADLAQEVFLRAHRGLPRFRGESALSTWLYRIAVNVCRTHVARRREHEPLEETSAVAEAAGIEGLERAQQIARVRDAVRRLPEKQRATLILKIYQELTHDEVARILGTSVGTTKANLFHALANLRRMLGKTGGES